MHQAPTWKRTARVILKFHCETCTRWKKDIGRSVVIKEKEKQAIKKSKHGSNINQEVHNYLTIANQSCYGYPLQGMPTIAHQHYLAMKNGPSDLPLGSYDSLQCAKHCTT